MRIADPRPALCTVCMNSTAEVYIDMECVREGPLLRDSDTGEIATDPAGALISLEDVFICGACVRVAADLVAYKPDLDKRQLREIRRLEVANEHWRSTAAKFQRQLEEQLEANGMLAENPFRRKTGVGS